MNTFEQFTTSDKATEGIQIKLYRPDGTPTEEWVRVCGKDSKQYRLTLSNVQARKAELLAVRDKKDFVQDEEKIFELKTMLIAGCIIDWSIKEPACTPENAIAVLKKAPTLTDQLDKAIGDRGLFMSGPKS